MIWAALNKGTENLRAQVLLLNLEHHLWAWETLPKDKENVFILPWTDTATGSLCVLYCICHAVQELHTWYTFTFPVVAGVRAKTQRKLWVASVSEDIEANTELVG